MAKFTKDEFINGLKEMTILEVKELVDAMKEEFGVDPSAVAVAAAPAAEAAEDNAATLVADATHKYTVTVEWLSTAEEVPTVTEKTATINFDYEQA